MSNVEYGPCKMEVYTGGENQRIPEEQLKINGVYVVRLALTDEFKARNSMNSALEALQLPARIDSKTAPLPDRYMVDFSLLDLDLQVIRSISGQIRDGYILGAEGEQPGYFAEYGGLSELGRLEAEMAELFPETFAVPEGPSVPMPIAA